MNQHQALGDGSSIYLLPVEISWVDGTMHCIMSLNQYIVESREMSVDEGGRMAFLNLLQRSAALTIPHPRLPDNVWTLLAARYNIE